ncbi:unnamed protein product [Symbiodinium necroappetens]|uniref:Uncharacterized protein n=1 Tax=Symbiodinium necroappetens TaxID=1628268 RepID=A0A812KY71_9DINO|nr:unnamed protein product [Symbiodinium necroappetens]
MPWSSGGGRNLWRGAKKCRDDQWQAAGPKFHFVYWDACGGDAEGFQLEQAYSMEDAFEARELTVGPALCEECGGVMESWRHRFDMIHACIRMLAKEGHGLRPEVLTFSALSPGKCLIYDIHSFRAHNAWQRKNVLTESTTLGVALQVERGQLDENCGVQVRSFDGDSGRAVHLKNFAKKVVQAARNEEGAAALLVVDPEGVEVASFGLGAGGRGFFASQAKEDPIRQVLVLLGPIDKNIPNDRRNLIEACVEGGCDGPLRLAFTSWRLPNAAVGDLLMQHDRCELLPLLEDLRAVGEEQYKLFLKSFQTTLQVMALNAGQPDLVEAFHEAAIQNQKPVEELPLRPRPPQHPPPAHLKAKSSAEKWGEKETSQADEASVPPEPPKTLRMLPTAKKRPWRDAADDEIGDFIKKVDECEMVPDATA